MAENNDEFVKFIHGLEQDLNNGEASTLGNHNPATFGQLDDDEFSNIFNDPVVLNLLQEVNDDTMVDMDYAELDQPETTTPPGSENGIPGSSEPSDNMGFGNSVRLPVWPPSPVPFTCSCCQVLREIVHTNGQDVMRLEIHGRPGLIYHGVLLIQQFASTINQVNTYNMFDFCKKSIEGVKEFLVQYCWERKQSGFMRLEDPLAMFYDAISVGLGSEDDDSFDNTEFNFTPEPSSSRPSSSRPSSSRPSSSRPSSSKSAPVRTLANPATAEQRQRVGALTVEDIGKYFHLKMYDAAKKLNVCETVVKNLCRKAGIRRWPYRKFASLQTKKKAYDKILRNGTEDQKRRAQQEIDDLERKIYDSLYKK